MFIQADLHGGRGEQEPNTLQGRVLILAPARNDAPTLKAILERVGIVCMICQGVEDMCREIPRGIGAAIIAEEAFAKTGDIDAIHRCLACEPAWSEPPLLIVAGSGGGSLRGRGGWFPGIANVIFLERPLRTATLTSAVRAALLARGRQLQVAQHLQIRERNEQRLRTQESQLRQLAGSLEERVEERTRELAATNAQLLEEGERRAKAERALVQAQKMEAIGQLTGGVAHDFNNLLMAVLSGVELIKRTNDAEKRDRILAGIQQAANRGKALTQQLLTFARNIELRAEPLDVRKLVEGMNILVAGALRGDISVEIDTPADLWLALADITQLELAILNLVVNARDAMPTGGVLRVSARNRHYPGSNGLRGDFVELSFADTGEGIPPEHIERIFDPFFTTKAVGKGTGLGLSQVYGFVRQSGGDVRVVSALGQGTTITLLIPRALPAAITAEHVAESGTQFRGKGECVLLVEDNDAVGEVIGQMLELIGLSIHRVSSARQALQLVRDGQPFDLVLSDIVMPGGMSGIDLARAVRDSRMDLPVVLITGYSQAIKDAVKLNVPILRKPFSIDELSVVVQKALAGRQKS